jgi:hypothetical protein
MRPSSRSVPSRRSVGGVHSDMVKAVHAASNASSDATAVSTNGAASAGRRQRRSESRADASDLTTGPVHQRG